MKQLFEFFQSRELWLLEETEQKCLVICKILSNTNSFGLGMNYNDLVIFAVESHMNDFLYPHLLLSFKLEKLHFPLVFLASFDPN